MAHQSRRGFLNGLLPVVGGIGLVGVASTLAGCVAGGEQDEAPEQGGSSAQRIAYRPVQLRPGMRYQNIMPRTVPAVRLQG